MTKSRGRSILSVPTVESMIAQNALIPSEQQPLTTLRDFANVSIPTSESVMTVKCFKCGRDLNPLDVGTWTEHSWWERKNATLRPQLFVEPMDQAKTAQRYCCSVCMPLVRVDRWETTNPAIEGKHD